MATKIYTKTGDDGTTGLFGGSRLPKDHIRIEAYGSVDELNSVIGWLMTYIDDDENKTLLSNIQSRLFTVGSNLASDPEKEMITPDLAEDDIKIIEEWIDVMQNVLPRLNTLFYQVAVPLWQRLMCPHSLQKSRKKMRCACS
jgi:cob(I)alamin adenosyltransferase